MSRCILVVEDNPIMRRMLRLTLASAGHQVLEAPDAHTGLDVAAERSLDAVVLDLGLPDFDGAELLELLRSQPGREELPAIALSGQAKRRGEPELERFEEFLIKPVEPSRLIDAVARVLAEPTRPELVPDPEPEAERAAPPHVLVADDYEVQRHLLVLRLRQLGYEVTAAADGQAALEAAQTDPPDAVISDVLMPGLDGFKLCQALRGDERFADVHVILMSSAYVEEADRELATESGADVLIERTPDLEEMLSALNHALAPGRPAPTALFTPAVDDHHAERVANQADLQAAENEQLRSRLALQSVELSVLGSLSDMLTSQHGLEPALDEVLASCADMTGIARAAVYLRADSGEFELAADVGFLQRDGLDDFYGAAYVLHAAVAEEYAVSIPSSRVDDVTSARLLSQAHLDAVVVAPLVSDGVGLGAIAFGTNGRAPSDEEHAFIRAVAGQLRQALALKRTVEALERSQQRTIERLALAAEFRDSDTANHTERVSRYCALLGRLAGLDERRCELLRLGSMLHDIGKLGVPDTILLKPGPLTETERIEMQRHTEYGYRILAAGDDELLDVAATIALTHHERWDGMGYPHGLSGTDIPLEGRIVAVADVFDAVTSDRVYRPAMALEPALTLLRDGRGHHFDPSLLDVFLEALPEILTIRDECLFAGEERLGPTEREDLAS
jgi:putative two-component system response regulator